MLFQANADRELLEISGYQIIWRGRLGAHSRRISSFGPEQTRTASAVRTQRPFSRMVTPTLSFRNMRPASTGIYAAPSAQRQSQRRSRPWKAPPRRLVGYFHRKSLPDDKGRSHITRQIPGRFRTFRKADVILLTGPLGRIENDIPASYFDGPDFGSFRHRQRTHVLVCCESR